MDGSAKEKTAFAFHQGLFEFNVMPFDLLNVPAVYHELIFVVSQGLGYFAIAYFYDILVFSLEDYLQHLDTIFDRSRKHDFKRKLKNA